MRDAQTYSVILILAGLVLTARNVLHARDPNRLRAYVETSPKAALWRSLLGVERAVLLTQRVFLPLGLLLSAGMTVYGAWTLMR